PSSGGRRRERLELSFESSRCSGRSRGGSSRPWRTVAAPTSIGSRSPSELVGGSGVGGGETRIEPRLNAVLEANATPWGHRLRTAAVVVQLLPPQPLKERT